MNIKNFKNEYIKAKKDKYIEFYEELKNLDDSITKEEAEEILLRVNPLETELIKINSINDLLTGTMSIVDQVLYPLLKIKDDKAIISHRNEYLNVYFIRGKKAKAGEVYTSIYNEENTKLSKLDKNESYIFIRERNVEDYPEEILTFFKMVGKEYENKYQVVVYVPKDE